MALNPKRVVLPNGITVLAKANHTSPTISLVVGVRTGAYSDPPDRDGTAALCARVLDRGTAKRSAEMIADELDGRGASLSVVAGRHQMALAATCLAEDFDPVLMLAADVVRHPAFTDHEIATRKEQLITAIRQEEDNPATVAGDAFAKALYGTHPYARKVRGTVEAIEHIRRQDLVRFHQKGFDPPMMTVVVVGDMVEDFAVAAIAKLFGDWSPSVKPTGDKPLAITVPDPAPPAARQLVSVPMMNKSQADVVYGFVGVRRSDPDFTAISVMNNALGQYAIGGKLGDSIRERQGMAYYVYSSLDATFGSGPFSIRAGVAAANVEKTVASIDHELKAVIRDGFTAQEIEESKSYMIGSLPRQLETNAAIASFLLNVETFGLGLDYDERLPGLIKAVSKEAADAAARRLLNPDKAVVAVAGPWSPPSIASIPSSSAMTAGAGPLTPAAPPPPLDPVAAPPVPLPPTVPAVASGRPLERDDDATTRLPPSDDATTRLPRSDDATARLPRLAGSPPPLGDTPSSSGETGS